MSKRWTTVLAAVTLGLLIAGVAWAGSGDDSATAEVSAETVIPVNGVGTVRIEELPEGLSLLNARPEAGWSATIETAFGPRIEVRFEGAAGRVDVDAELENGEVRVRVERVAADGSSTTSIATTSSIGTTSSLATSSTNATSSTSSSLAGSSTSTSLGGGTSSTSTSLGGGTSSTSTTMNDDAGTSTTMGGSTSTTMDDDAVSIPDAVRTFVVGGAAVVVIEISGGTLTLLSVDVNAGWSYEIDKAEADDVRVEFESGEAEAELRVRIDDGALRVETRLD